MNSAFTLIVLTMIRLAFPISILFAIGERLERKQKAVKGEQ